MRKKVLITEDEFVVAHNLRLILTEAGYLVQGIAASVQEAEALLQTGTPDLAIVDIRLKGKLSGIDIARRLRTDNVPFVYLSANNNQAILEEAKETEPYGFLVKPFRKKDLLVMLEIAWYRHQHSLDAKWRREEQLQKSLTAISTEPVYAEEALLRIARTVQPHVSFDFFSCGIRPMAADKFTDIGYLRTGFDEYRFIGEQELLNITNLTSRALHHLASNGGDESLSGIYVPELNSDTGRRLLQNTIMNRMGMRSCLSFPFTLGFGLKVLYFFFSRRADTYSTDHVALLNRLKPFLEDIANKTLRLDNPPKGDKQQPPSVATKQTKQSNNPGFEGVIGSHHLLLSALDLAAQVAPYTTSVLLLGESGTGKEKVAQSIHQLSPRKNRPFVKVNCAAIPPTLIESELFGHEKGAFTGATEKRKGKFELAHTGTIFLDEIGELPLDLQVKLLRVLQEKEMETVGSSLPQKVDVRIIAATNRNLEKEVAERNFRLDLYYRLNVFPITLPPLRERRSDTEALALYFAERFCREFTKPFTGFSDVMITDMMQYDWPGNVRELENVVEQAVILNDGRSKLALRQPLRIGSTLWKEKPDTHSPDGMKERQMETERQYIIAALRKANGRIRGTNGAAEILKIKPTTLESKMARLNINKENLFNDNNA